MVRPRISPRTHRPACASCGRWPTARKQTYAEQRLGLKLTSSWIANDPATRARMGKRFTREPSLATRLLGCIVSRSSVTTTIITATGSTSVVGHNDALGGSGPGQKPAIEAPWCKWVSCFVADWPRPLKGPWSALAEHVSNVSFAARDGALPNYDVRQACSLPNLDHAGRLDVRQLRVGQRSGRPGG